MPQETVRAVWRKKRKKKAWHSSRHTHNDDVFNCKIRRPAVFHCLHSFAIIKHNSRLKTFFFFLNTWKWFATKPWTCKSISIKMFSLQECFKSYGWALWCDVFTSPAWVWSLMKYFIWLAIKPFACRARVSGPVNKSQLLLWHWKIL